MAECTQEAFLDRVRHALGDRGEPIPLPDPREIARVVKPGSDTLKLFLTRIEQSHIQPHHVADEVALADKVAEIAASVAAKTALVPAEDIPGRERILAALREKGVQLADANEPDAAFSADMGITGAAGAIAETASVALVSGGPRRRLASLAVPVAVAVVRADQIAADLLDWAGAQPDKPPACQTLVSGPSKTADIELVLVIGVHGPREQHVIVVG